MHQADVHAVKPHIVSVVVRKLMNQYNELRMHAAVVVVGGRVKRQCQVVEQLTTHTLRTDA